MQFDDDLQEIADDLSAKTLKNPVIKTVSSLFPEAYKDHGPFKDDEILEHIQKLSLQSGLSYLDPKDADFPALAREAIYKFSEVDLGRLESEEIVRSLVELVQRKSFSEPLLTLDESAFDESVGVGLGDLLNILSISKGAYAELKSGGDPSAIRNASIIQRKLERAGATPDVIEHCTRWKVSWDIWLRDKRHSLAEFDLIFLQTQLNKIKEE